MEVQKTFIEDMRRGLGNYKNLQLKFRFRDLWVAIVNKEVIVAGESIKYVEEKASKLTGKGEKRMKNENIVNRYYK